MALNVRRDRVVEPNHIAEFDRIQSVSPFAVVVVGALLFVTGTATTLVFWGNDFVALSSTVLSFAVLITAVFVGVRLATLSQTRVAEISRWLHPLREVAVFDEGTIPDGILWEVAGLAIELEELEEANSRLASALVRTPEQESTHAEYERARLVLAESILALLTHSA